MTARDVHEHRWFRRVLRWGNVAAWIVLIGIVIVIVVQYQQVQSTASKAKTTADSLADVVHDTRVQASQLRQVVDDTHAGGCALRADLLRRAHGTLAFIRSHPNGILGVPVEALRADAENQLKTARTLDRLHC